MQQIDRGTLVIADIGGYTRYLTGVELQHSSDVLADLLNHVVEPTRGTFHLAKLEGDAVFSYALDRDLTGQAFISAIEACYFSFQDRLRTILRNTTCQCGACLRIPSLDLKFVAHSGEFARHVVAGSNELVGPDVIVVHRLLKNYVVDRTAVKGYALLTDALVRRLELDPAALRMTPHAERYDDVGDLPCYVVDLERRWQEQLDQATDYISPDAAMVAVGTDLDSPPAVVWEYLNSPQKMLLWAADGMTQDNPRGERGVGTVSHCAHGGGMVRKQVTDWKPFRYVTEEIRVSRAIRFRSTVELTTLDGGNRTRLDMRMIPSGGPAQRALTSLARGMMRQQSSQSIERLRNVLAREQPPA